MKRPTRFAAGLAAVALFCLAIPACDSSTEPEPEPDLTLVGNLDTGTLTGGDKAVPVDLNDDIWIVAVSRAGDIDASCGMLQPLEAVMPFSLAVRSGHDYVLEFRTDYYSGPTLAVLCVEEGAAERGVFKAPAGTGTIDLGTVTIDPAAGVATSDAGPDLAQQLPPPASGYPDLDGDLLPDAFDRDDDNDGITDDDDRIPGIYRYSLSGGRLDLQTAVGDFEARIWMEGSCNSSTGRMVLDEAGPARFIITSHLDFDIWQPEFAVWVDSLPLVTDGQGNFLQANLRIGSPGHVRVKAVADAAGTGQLGFRIIQVEYEEVVAQAEMTCEDLRCLGEDLESQPPYLVMAWLGVEGVRAMNENAYVVLRAFENCIQRKQQIQDRWETHAGPLTLPCFTFPGDGTCGETTFAWQDDQTDGDITPGDSFLLTFANCWLDNGEEVVDELLEGQLHLRNYIDSVTQQGGPLMGAVDVVFTGLTRTETMTDGEQHVLDAGSEITTWSHADDGGYGGPALLLVF